MTWRNSATLVVALVAISFPIMAGAVEFVVDTIADTEDADLYDDVCRDAAGNCSLRAAIEQANFLFGEDSIVVPAGTYNLEDTLFIADFTIVTGAGPQQTILDGSLKTTSDEALIMMGTESTIQLEGLAITNSVGEWGGGIHVGADTFLKLYDVEIHHNTATYGGGLFVSGSLKIERCAIYDNTADHGGGFMLETYGEINNSTISGNHANVNGGGIYFIEGSLAFMYNMTITNNVADADGSGSGDGGGIMIQNATQSVDGPAMGSSIVAGNECLTCSSVDIDGLMGSEDYNLIGDATGAVFYGSQDHNIVGADPVLGELALNGGQTMNHALLEGSPAIDTAQPFPFFDVDQRGIERPQGSNYDMGAYEYDGEIFSDGFESGNFEHWWVAQ